MTSHKHIREWNQHHIAALDKYGMARCSVCDSNANSEPPSPASMSFANSPRSPSGHLPEVDRYIQ